MRFLSRLAFLACVSSGLTLFPKVTEAAGYVLTDLGLGSAVAINSSGVIALNRSDRVFRVTGDIRQELKIVTFAGQTPFEEFEVFYSGQDVATAINNAGEIVGNIPNPFIGFWDNGVTNVVAGPNDTPYPAATPFAVSYAINNLGVVCGSWLGGVWPSLEPVPEIFRMWPSYTTVAAPTLVGTLSSGGSQPISYRPKGLMEDIGDDGVAVGTIASANLRPKGGADPLAYFKDSHRGRAAKVEGNVITFLDQRAADDHPGLNYPPLSEAFAINESGQVVGRMALIADGAVHAFRHAGAGLEDLGTLGGTNSGALDVNSSGLIVGYAEIANGQSRACLWQAGAIVDLNSFLPAGSALVLTKAHAVNNGGQIVGEARLGGVTKAFLLSPDTLGIAPQVTLHPQGTSVALGGTVTLTVAATGSLPISVQWKRGNSVIEGATSLTLQLTNVSALDNGEYRAVLTNSSGEAISQPALITVLDPKLKTQLQVVLTVEGSVGATYRIEFTPTLGPENWQALTNLTLTSPLQAWVDFDSSTTGQRTYRAIRLPTQ